MDRRCGDCTLCCTLTQVPELNKPINKTCLFCKRGCSVYERRPQSCRDFQCAWLQGDLPDWMRPDLVHVMIEKLPDVPVVLALVEPGHDDWRDNNRVIEVLREKYQHEGIAVMASDKLALLPNGRTSHDVMRDVKIAAKAMGYA